MADDPITLASRLPGDAVASPSPSPSPPRPAASSVASTSRAVRGPARTVVLTSVHPTDPAKQRAFEYRLYAPPSSSAAHAQATRAFLSLPESYLDMTPTELQQANAGLVKRRQGLVDAPLLTQKLRDQHSAQQHRAKVARYPYTAIRIRFPDRSQLEGVFPSSDKLVHLYEFVRLALRPDVRDCPFVLYQTPPRTEYRRGAPQYKGKTLLDLDFTPNSAFYIKFEPPEFPSPLDALNDAAAPPPLVQELLDAVGELPVPPSFDPREQDKDDGRGESDAARKKREKEEKLKRLLGGGGSGAGRTLGSGGAKGGVTPSWMKLGKDAHKK